MKCTTQIFLFSITFFIISCSPIQEKTLAPPLVDGSIEDYLRLGVTPINLEKEVNLYFYQDQHYVWIAYDYLDGSFGTLDLVIESPNLNGPLNIHVSAQIGEWPVDSPELAPDNPESDRWWNHNGWYANEVWSNGTDRSGDTPRPKFKNGQARELQLSKERFGRGVWKIKMNIRAILDSNGNRSNHQFPKDDQPYILRAG